MKIFHCGYCGQLLFFENTKCVSCGHRVAYLPDLRRIASLEADGEETWRSLLPKAAKRAYRLCRNDKFEGICNWAVPTNDDNPLCGSCRITFANDFLADLLPYVEKNYRVLTDRQSRAIAGLSMGGNQTLNIAIPHLDRFGYVGVFSSGIISGARGGAAAEAAGRFGEAWEKQISTSSVGGG
jgi:hypothetical protein